MAATMQSHSPAVGDGAGSSAGLAVSSVTIAEQVACVVRELAMRNRVYKRWVIQGKLTQSAADLEIIRMDAVLATLKRAQLEFSGREAGQLFSGEVYGPAKVRADERAKMLSILAPMVHTDVLMRLEAKLKKQDVPASDHVQP
jgi:hypothetical protein